MSFGKAPTKFEVFSVEDSTAQLVWRDLGTGLVTVRVGARSFSPHQGAALGTLVVDGLEPDTAYQAVLTTAQDTQHAVEFRTLPQPRGEQLCRIGTLNDVHIGSYRFGFTGVLREWPSPKVVSGSRCAEAAFAELAKWDPQHVVLKGDIVHHGSSAEYELLGKFLDEIEVPFDYVMGNHERRSVPDIGKKVRGSPIVDPFTALVDRGFSFGDSVRVRDLPGVRLVLVESALEDDDRGSLAAVGEAALDAAAQADTPVLVFLHQNLQRRDPAWMLPFGIPAREATPFLDRLATLDQTVIVSSGHTHRCRRRDHRGVTVVEVGSTKDYPGVWGGYAVHEGGIRQVLRRVERSTCLHWTERTRRGALTAWARWAPGTLEDRCFLIDT